MKNIDAIKQMPLKNFANAVFHMARYDCKNEEEFEKLLDREVPTDLEDTLKEALQGLQHPSLD